MNREHQQRLDRIAERYLDALDAADVDTLEAIWKLAESETDIREMLFELNAEAADAADREAESVVLNAIRQHLPGAEIVASAAGPLIVAEVAMHLRKHPPVGLSVEELTLNDSLAKSTVLVPEDLGISRVLKWGGTLGQAPESYWRAFREAALKLRMQRDSAENFQMAARSPRKPKEG